MESNKRKRDVWDDDEVIGMLEIIKERHIIELLDNKTKRNKVIYEEVSHELNNKNMNKTSDQIRGKFKALKSDYFNMKRNNKKSGAQRQTNKYFYILEEMLAHRPSLTAEEIDTSQTPSTTIGSLLPVVSSSETTSATSTTTATSTTPATSTTSATSTTTATSITSATSTTTKTSTTTANANTLRVTSKIAPKVKLKNFYIFFIEKTSYEKVIKALSEVWKKIQNEVLGKMQQQNEKSFGELRKHRFETERILENDRLETAKLLESFLQLSQRSNWQPMTFFRKLRKQCHHFHDLHNQCHHFHHLHNQCH